MDSVTQAVLGAAVGDTVFRHQAGKRALLWGAAIGSLPDIDALGGLFSDAGEIILHRSFTHSILFVAIATFVLGPVLQRLNRGSEIELAKWRQLVFWCLATHVLLDCFTTYGTKVLLPFSNTPISFRAISVIDPGFTLPVILSLLLAIRASWRTLAIRISLGWCACYLILALGIKAYVHSVATSAGIPAERIMTKPTPLNLFLWRINLDCGDRFLVGYYSLFDSDPPRFAEFAKDHEKLAQFADSPAHQLLARTMGDWYVVRDGPVICDLRYGRLLDWQTDVDSAWVFSYSLEGETLTRLPRDMSAIREQRSAFLPRVFGN
ncbi:MAG: inner membrane protein [Rhodothermales bacterium]